MNSPRVAVLLATYNGAQWLSAQVESIQSQIGVEVSLIVSDDASTDDSRALVASLLRPQDSQLPASERLGSAAQNFFRLLRSVSSDAYDFVALADQDDIWEADKLARGIEELNSRGAAGYSSSVMAFWPDGSETLLRKNFPQRRWDHLFESPGPGCTFILERALVRSLQDWLKSEHPEEERTVGDCHDWVIYAFARHRGCPWYIDGMPSLKYSTTSLQRHGGSRGVARLHVTLAATPGGLVSRAGPEP